MINVNNIFILFPMNYYNQEQNHLFKFNNLINLQNFQNSYHHSNLWDIY